jgi:N-acetylneuraminic acid mutarotase
MVWTGGSTDVDIYDVATDTWSLSHMSTEGDKLTTATTGNKVFFAGGNFGIYATSTVNIYDLTSNTWSTASLSAPRNFPAAVSANNKVYFAGGDPWTGQISNVIDIY